MVRFLNSKRMSGHSKWATTKRQKEAADQKRGASFTRLARAIYISAKQGGGDPEMNFALRLAIAKAKSANMPKENIERTIERATGAGLTENVEEVTYEAFGPGGTALIIEATTDNRNRLISEVKLALSRNGGKLAESGGALRFFKHVGRVLVRHSDYHGTADALTLKLMDASPDDLIDGEDGVVCIFSLDHVRKAVEFLEQESIPHTVEVVYLPQARVEVKGSVREELHKLIGALTSIDDVSAVYTNGA